MSRFWLATLAMIGLLASGGATAEPLPAIQKRGSATQLIVNGEPYLILGGELHNSSPSSPEFMKPVWEKLARNHVKTVIGVASWELVEPAEGRFDFTAVDDQIRQAAAHDMRLVLIWFGGYKNADSNYTPSWVRRDSRRFARAARDPATKPRGIVAYLGLNPAVSVFSDALAAADARAFAALMRHIRQVDPKHTVIMVQVENEVGLLGESRDRSTPASRAWAAPVPSTLTDYLRRHRSTLRPDVRAAWERQGARTAGTWADVFGTDKAAEEIFMAWHFARYVDRVAAAGAAELPLPMYANAWLARTPGAGEPGDYPSGGPVAHMMDVWKAGAPTLALLAPDVYVDGFDAVLADYRRADNPIFVPEAKPDVGNLFVALGQHHAIGFSPFGIEDVADGSPLFRAYAALDGMSALIAGAQADNAIRGFRLAAGAKVKEVLGGYSFELSGPLSTLGAMGAGTGAAAGAVEASYGLIIEEAKDSFLVVGRGINIRFSAPDTSVEIDQAQEGSFAHGRWIPGRTLNGDERYALFPPDELRIVRFRLLRR